MAIIDAEITERISKSVTSYTIESNECTFKPDTIFDRFYHQAKFPSRTEPYWWYSWCCVKSVCCAHPTSWGHCRWCSLPDYFSRLWSVSWLALLYGRLSSERASSFVTKILQCSGWGRQRGQRCHRLGWWAEVEDTKSSCRVALHILHSMVHYALPVSDVSSAVV